MLAHSVKIIQTKNVARDFTSGPRTWHTTKIMNSKTGIYLVIGLVMYLTAAGISYSIFRGLGKVQPGISQATPTPAPKSKRPTIDPAIPRTEVCLLNGLLYTKQEKDIWVTRRPLAVMIENSADSRPQSGLSYADIVYEAVAEGGISRFMGLFYCGVASAGNLTLAPVRSARIYFVNIVPEYDPLYVHVGGAGNCDDPNVDPKAKALCAIQQYKIKDMDQMGRAGDFKTCHRLTNRLDKEVAWEHTMACFVEELAKSGAKWGWTNVDKNGVSWDKNFVSWKFKTDSDKVTGASAKNISYMFWEYNREFNGDYDVSWEYQPASNSYRRSNGGKVSIDLETEEPLLFKNVVIQYAKETFLQDLEKHLLYDVIGTGKAKIFMDGVVIDGTWAKASKSARTIFKDSAGKEIKFNPGPIWISILPSTNTVTYN